MTTIASLNGAVTVQNGYGGPSRTAAEIALIDAAKAASLAAIEAAEDAILTPTTGTLAVAEAAAILAVSDEGDIQVAAVAAEGAAQIADIIATPGSDEYASTTNAVSNGVWSVAVTAGGSGGTDNTYQWTTSGGAGSNAAGYLTVAGGAITSVVVTNRGYGYTSAPTIVIAGTHNVTGHTLTPSISQNQTAGSYFIVKVSGGFAVYTVTSGTTTSLVETYPTITETALLHSKENYSEGLAPLYDFIRTDDAEVFSRGDYTDGWTTTNASLKGWRAPFKHDGTYFNAVELTVKATATNTRVLVKILDSAKVEIARGYSVVDTTLMVITAVMDKVVRSLAADAIAYISYEPADAGGVLSYPGGYGANNYPVGDADPATYREQYLNASDVWSNASPTGNYCIPFRLMLYTGEVARGALESINTALVLLNSVIAAGSVTVWENAGFTGYDTTYSQDGVGTQSGTMGVDATFNSLIVYGGCAGEGIMRGYSVDPATATTHVPSVSDTLLFEVAINWDAAVSERSVDLGAAYTVPAGRILQVLWVSNTLGQDVSIARFSSDPGAAAPVTRISVTGSGDPSGIWSESWSNATRSYVTVPPRLLLALPGQSSAVPLQEPYFTIPAVVNAVVGTELNLYHDAIFSARSNGLGGLVGYSVSIIGTVGKNKQRRFSLTPVSGDIGTKSMIATAKDSAGNVVATRAFSIVIRAATAPGSAKNVLLCGDSLMAVGTISATVQANFAALGATVPTFIGTQGTVPAKHEGRGGKTYNFFATSGGTAYRFTVSGVGAVGVGSTWTTGGITYTITEVNITAGSGTVAATGASAPAASGTLTKVSGTGDATIAFSASSTESGNPFWTTALDIAAYRSANSIAAVIDVASFQLGVNDVFGEALKTPAQLTAILDYARDIADAFLADNAAGIIIFQIPTLCGNTGDGFAANYGSAYSREIYEANIFALRTAMITAFDSGAYHANVKVGSAGLQVDRYFGYTLTATAAAARITTTTDEHVNGVHPNTDGYEQNGDATFSDVLANL